MNESKARNDSLSKTQTCVGKYFANSDYSIVLGKAEKNADIFF